MSVEAVLAIAGVAFFVYGLLGVKVDVKLKDFAISTGGPLEKWQRVVLIVLGLALIALTTLLSVGVLPPTPASQTPVPVPTLAETPTAVPDSLVIDSMDSMVGWSTYEDDKGSTGMLRVTPGLRNEAVEIAYDLEADGWVGVFHNVEPGSLSGTDGIRFFYSGDGARNTIELKLIYEPDSNGKSPVFSVTWMGATVADTWAMVEVPYSEFRCWEDTGCSRGDEVDLDKVWRVDFAISNKPGDTPGIGHVRIDEIQVID